MAGRSGSLDDADARAAAGRVRSEWERAVTGLRAWIDGAAPR
jgi:hypothetical protein